MPARRIQSALALVLVLGVALAVAGCSSSRSSSASSSTTTSAASSKGTSASGGGSGSASADAVQKGILVVVESSDSSKPPTQPAGFLACVAGKLSAADKVAIAKVTDSSSTPNDLGVRAMQAANRCNRAFLISVLKGQLSGSDGIPGITDTQATCAATKGVDAIVGLDAAKLGSGTDSKVANTAVGKALDTCYPVKGFLSAELKQQDAGITDAQITCIEGKLGADLSWVDVSDSAFESKLTDASSACGVSS